MCGGCAGAPHDWAAELVSGPRRRSAVARRLSALMKRDQVRAIASGWVVSAPTGLSVVCRTYDELVSVVSERTDVDRSRVSATGLAWERERSNPMSVGRSDAAGSTQEK
jgi:hypothetical protein